MSDTVLHPSMLEPRGIELSQKERTQLDTVIDLLIPSDDDFPSPSSLRLADEFLYHLVPRNGNRATLVLNEKRLRIVLDDLNTLANGDFCCVSTEQQHQTLKVLEQRDPALFQGIWSLANHCYYTLLAMARRRHRQAPRSRMH